MVFGKIQVFRIIRMAKRNWDVKWRECRYRPLLTLFLMALLAAQMVALPDQTAPKQTVYSFSLVDINGKTVPLSNYKGKVLLIVNLASQSTYRDQITALNDLQNSYAAQGLVVIGIPSSDFGGKELKGAAAVREYYIDKLHVAFPLFAPAKTRGVETIPLFAFLCDGKAGLPGGELHWSFTKFIVDRDGQPLARYELSEDPAEASFHLTIESALAGKLKKQSETKKDGPSRDQDDDK
jgi:glutathione peroxidase